MTPLYVTKRQFNQDDSLKSDLNFEFARGVVIEEARSAIGIQRRYRSKMQNHVFCNRLSKTQCKGARMEPTPI